MPIWLIIKLKAFNRHRAKVTILCMLFFVLIFGSIAFYYFERDNEEVEDIWDAAYWVMVTITTVGFGDITPKTAGGRITFAFVALGGIGTLAYIIEEAVSISAKRQLEKMFGLGVAKMKNHTIIAGWNTKTEEAINELKSIGEEFLVVGIDLDQALLNSAGIVFIAGDPTKSGTLNRCNIKYAKTLLIPLESDSETIMVALAARKINRDITIVATCDLQEHVEMMRGAGVNHIISHTELGGRLLVHAVNEPVIVDFIMNVSTSAGGIKLRQKEVSAETKFSDISLMKNEKVIAIYRGEIFLLDFTVDMMLEKGDRLVIISTR